MQNNTDINHQEDQATVHLGKVNRAIQAYRALQKMADDLRESHTEDVLNGSFDEEKSQKVEKAYHQLEVFRVASARQFPKVKEFVKEESNGGPRLQISELSCLMGVVERPEGKHGSVYRNIKGFTDHLERYCASQGIDLDFEHEKRMPSLLGKQYRAHYEAKRCAVFEQRTLVTWGMVKGWLDEYIDTPK